MIQLVATDGAIIADTTTALNVMANSTANVGVSNIDAELDEAQVVDEPAETRGTTGAEERLANLDAPMAASGDLCSYQPGVPRKPRAMMRTRSH